jgi:hypothetical protein
MKNYVRTAAVSLFAAAALGAGAVAPASAAPVITGGLVNVTVVDLVDLTNTSVNVPVTVAAQICGVSVQALVVDLGPDGTITDCDQDVDTITTVTQRKR